MANMCRTLYDNYVNKVSDNDYVVFLGDVFFTNSNNLEMCRDMFRSFPGNKILIRGNHDRKDDQFYLDCGFLAVTDYLIAGRYFFCHYPCAPGNPAEAKYREIFEKSRCDTIIHGHIHTKDSPVEVNITRINCCVDYEPNNYSPVLLSESKSRKVEKVLESLIESNS